MEVRVGLEPTSSCFAGKRDSRSATAPQGQFSTRGWTRTSVPLPLRSRCDKPSPPPACKTVDAFTTASYVVERAGLEPAFFGLATQRTSQFSPPLEGWASYRPDPRRTEPLKVTVPPRPCRSRCRETQRSRPLVGAWQRPTASCSNYRRRRLRCS